MISKECKIIKTIISDAEVEFHYVRPGQDIRKPSVFHISLNNYGFYLSGSHGYIDKNQNYTDLVLLPRQAAANVLEVKLVTMENFQKDKNNLIAEYEQKIDILTQKLSNCEQQIESLKRKRVVPQTLK